MEEMGGVTFGMGGGGGGGGGGWKFSDVFCLVRKNIKKNCTETYFHCRNTDIAIAYYNLRVSLVGGPITQNFDKSNSYC